MRISCKNVTVVFMLHCHIYITVAELSHCGKNITVAELSHCCIYTPPMENDPPPVEIESRPPPMENEKRLCIPSQSLYLTPPMENAIMIRINQKGNIMSDNNIKEDKKVDLEKVIKDQLKKDGISEEWMKEHLIVEMWSET